MASKIIITAQGIPDGVYTAVLDKSDGTRLTRENVTFTNSQASTVFKGLAVDEDVKGYVDDNAPQSTKGAYIESRAILTTDSIGELYNNKELSTTTEIHE